MSKTKAFVAALAATTLLSGGFALAAEQSSSTPAAGPAARKVDNDVTKLSKDGADAYLDVARARLAIFDGKTVEAKTDVDAADTAFDRAKTDRSVFMKAEADLKAPNDKAKAANEKAEKAMAETVPGSSEKTTQDAKTPIAWLPVDGDVILNEDFKAHPEKMAAVKDANESLKKDDQKSAMQKLKLADVDIDYVVAVVPLKATLADVHQAAEDIGAGKYYEGSQLLRKVQDSAHYDVLDVNAVPKTAATSGSQPAKTKTN